MIFLDASVLLAAEDADDPHHVAATRLLESGEPLATIDLAVYEVTNVALARWKDAEAARRLRDRVWAIGEHGELVRADRALGEAIVGLVVEHGVNAYDAAYVAGAQRVGVPLASCDERDLVGRGLARLPDSVWAP